MRLHFTVSFLGIHKSDFRRSVDGMIKVSDVGSVDVSPLTVICIVRK